MIDVQNLSKTYGKNQAKVHALKGVNLSVSSGDFISIMGCSGSGKSTLMNIVGCLDRPTTGTYFFNGMDVSKQNKDKMSDIRNKHIGFVFQSFFLLPKLTALQNLELPMLYNGIGKKQRKQRANHILDMVGLTDRATHFPSKLSGGQRQRIAIGRALTNNPDLILADEPTGNLDSQTGNEIMQILQALNKRGTTIVLITHEKQVAQYTNQTLILKDGQFLN
jgi:putative ABC transport system ATP-binding protein